MGNMGFQLTVSAGSRRSFGRLHVARKESRNFKPSGAKSLFVSGSMVIGKALEISFDPKPATLGGTTAGPSNSFHEKSIRPQCFTHSF